MKEAIKRGIKVEVLDRSENFISLKKCDKKEYVKFKLPKLQKIIM